MYNELYGYRLVARLLLQRQKSIIFCNLFFTMGAAPFEKCKKKLILALETSQNCTFFQILAHCDIHAFGCCVLNPFLCIDAIIIMDIYLVFF